MAINGNVSSTTTRQKSTLGLARFYFEKAREYPQKKQFFLSKSIRTLEEADQQSLGEARIYLRWATLLNKDLNCTHERDECLQQCKRILDSFPIDAYRKDFTMEDSFGALAVARFCHDFGDAYFQAGNLDDALYCLDAAIGLFHRNGIVDAEVVRSTHYLAAQICLQQDAFDSARYHYSNAMKTTSHISSGLVRIFCEIVLADFNEDGYRQRIERNCRTTIRVMEKFYLASTEPLDRGRVHCLLGLAHWKLGNINDALVHAEQAIQILEEDSRESQDSWQSRYIMGQFLLRRKAVADAVGHFQQGLEIAESINSMSELATTYQCMGWVFYNQRDYDQALSYTLKALTIQESLCDPIPRKLAQSYRQLGLVYHNMGLVCHNRGDYDQARNFIQKAIEIQEGHCASDTLALAQSYKLLGIIYDSQGERARASMSYRKAIEHFEASGDVEFDIYLRLGLAASYAKRKRRDIEHSVR